MNTCVLVLSGYQCVRVRLTSKSKSAYLTVFDLLSTKTQRLKSTVRVDYEEISTETRTY